VISFVAEKMSEARIELTMLSEGEVQFPAQSVARTISTSLHPQHGLLSSRIVEFRRKRTHEQLKRQRQQQHAEEESSKMLEMDRYQKVPTKDDEKIEERLVKVGSSASVTASRHRKEVVVQQSQSARQEEQDDREGHTATKTLRIEVNLDDESDKEQSTTVTMRRSSKILNEVNLPWVEDPVAPMVVEVNEDDENDNDNDVGLNEATASSLSSMINEEENFACVEDSSMSLVVDDNEVFNYGMNSSNEGSSDFQASSSPRHRNLHQARIETSPLAPSIEHHQPAAFVMMILLVPSIFLLLRSRKQKQNSPREKIIPGVNPEELPAERKVNQMEEVHTDDQESHSRMVFMDQHKNTMLGGTVLKKINNNNKAVNVVHEFERSSEIASTEERKDRSSLPLETDDIQSHTSDNTSQEYGDDDDDVHRDLQLNLLFSESQSWTSLCSDEENATSDCSDSQTWHTRSDVKSRPMVHVDNPIIEALEKHRMLMDNTFEDLKSGLLFSTASSIGDNTHPTLSSHPSSTIPSLPLESGGTASSPPASISWTGTNPGHQGWKDGNFKDGIKANDLEGEFLFDFLASQMNFGVDEDDISMQSKTDDENEKEQRRKSRTELSQVFVSNLLDNHMSSSWESEDTNEDDSIFAALEQHRELMEKALDDLFD